MSVTLRTDQAKREIATLAGTTLLRMAVLVQTAGKAKVNTSNQQGRQPSQPGEWLRKRTGHGQAGLVYSPTTPQAVAKAGNVRVGFTENAFYMALWGARTTGRRKSLLDLVEELKPRLAALGGRAT